MNMLEYRRSKPFRFEPRRESCCIGLSDLGAWVVIFVCAPPPRSHGLPWWGGGDRCGLARKIDPPQGALRVGKQRRAPQGRTHILGARRSRSVR